MAILKEGDWVRYTKEFCETSITTAGMNDLLSRRGRVIRAHSDGKLCDIDWGDVILQSPTDSSLHAVTDPPTQ